MKIVYSARWRLITTPDTPWLLVNLVSFIIMKICDPITNQQYKGCVIPMSNVPLNVKSKNSKQIYAVFAKTSLQKSEIRQ